MPSMTLTCAICNEPMQKSRTSAPQGQATHRACVTRSKHGLSGYRHGCRCDECKAAQNKACLAYAAKRKAIDGVGPTAQWRRAKRGIDPLAVINCTICGEPLEYVRSERVDTPMHKACKSLPKWKREGRPDPKMVRATKKAAAAKRAAEPKPDRRSDIRAGYEDGDYERFLRGLTAKTRVLPSGCWEWQGQSKRGYPKALFGKRCMQVHRLVIEAREGKPLGTLAAHHKCGNSICVSPEHLQPVTQRENMAEMLARTSLEARIAELEYAIATVDPAHPVLNRVSHLSAA